MKPGRKPKHLEPRSSTAVRLPISLAERLREEANRRDIAQNKIVTRALEKYLPLLEEQEVDLP